MLSTKLKEAAGNSADATLYVDDVFSTYLYTGNGSTQTITNGIDLAGKGGMTWIKSRSAATDHKLTNTTRGATKALISDTTDAETTDTTGLTAFSSTGFSLGASSVYNTNAATYASWTFRKAAKFFDVVTYTGNGTNQTIPHSLGVAPGMVITKATGATSNWCVWHRGDGTTNKSGLNLNGTHASAVSGNINFAFTSTIFNPAYAYGSTPTVANNDAGVTYVAYLFAHDTSSTGIIQCGTFTVSSGSGNTDVNLGFEPQWMLAKPSSQYDNWNIYDTMRGWVVRPGVNSNQRLSPNTSTQETADSSFQPTSTGFTMLNSAVYPGAPVTYIYMAIRMPNKPPTSGTQVYYSSLGTGGTPGVVSGFPPDLAIGDLPSNGGTYPYFPIWTDRLRGNNNSLVSSSTVVESSPLSSCIFYQTGFGTSAWNSVVNAWLFKRAPGFFDEVCSTFVTGTNRYIHNLTVAPELILLKSRSNTSPWYVYISPSLGGGYTKYLTLNTTDAIVNGSNYWGGSNATATDFGIANGSFLGNGWTFTAYLFATLAGISKVGSYTGNGTSQNINCGFAAGARFFLVKATSTTGSWWVWDSARGITAGNDPALQLNSTAAEITTADAVDPYSPGITVNQEATCSINANGVSYIFLAVA